MMIDPKNTNRLFVGTHSSGIYSIERPQPTASGGEASDVRQRIVSPK
jgi:hypothetical protein